MKKVLSLILVFCIFLGFCPAALSERENNGDALEGWNIRINVPGNAAAVLDGGEYYLYAQQEGSIPYVMVKTYRTDDAAAFLNEFTAFMKKQYPDLKVTSDTHEVMFGEKSCLETDYSYQVSGYDVRDRRVVMVTNGTAYLFTSKEIEELGMTVGSMLDDVVTNCELISGDEAEQNLGLSDGYLYCDGNGIPVYWLDFTRIVEDNLVLHCMFRSDEPVFTETCYVLDLSSAEFTENGLRIRRVRGLQDNGVAERFGNLTLRFYLDVAVMTADQNGETPAEDPEDQIPAGDYIMVPVGVAPGPGEKQSHIRPLGDGPYQPEELKMWARFYFIRNTGCFLPEAEVDEHPDNTYTITLYQAADSGDGQAHSVRYTVNQYGEGQDDATGAPVSLMR